MPTITFSEEPLAADETTVYDLDNELLSTLIRFARAIRDQRRDAAAIHARLLTFIFSITPAERVAVFPIAHDQIQMDAVAMENREDPTEDFAIKRSLIEHVRKTGKPVMSRSVLCVAMQAFHTQVGVIYADITGHSRFTRGHLELVLGVAAVAAITIEHAARVEVLETKNSLLQEDLDLRSDLVGDSPLMQELKAMIAKAAPTDFTILIQGESGTGKELVARAMHQNSKRSAGPFVAVNCGAITESLLESELFGHEKGAFTGAIAQKKGKFEIASGGTLFLDEVGELPPAMQVKLLRALQEREIERVGGTRALKVDFRLIAATNKDLESAVLNNEFRQDLYYRLKVVTVRTPSLRERVDDIPVLAQHFVAMSSAKIGRAVRSITAAALRRLMTYDWPGNVRELQNVIERAIALGSTDSVLPEDLPSDISTSRKRSADSPALNLKEIQDANERELLELALIKMRGDCQAVATALGIHSATVYRKVENLKLKHLTKRPRN